MHKIGKKLMIEFWEKVKKVHIWALFAQIWANENFPEKICLGQFLVFIVL